MVAHTFDSSTQNTEAGRSEFETSLVSKVNSRAIQRKLERGREGRGGEGERGGEGRRREERGSEGRRGEKSRYFLALQ